MAFADLHLHSTASDGNLSPRDLVGMAKAKGFAVVALTDHDTTQGLDEALTAGRDLSIQVVPGIELVLKPKARRSTSWVIILTMAMPPSSKFSAN